MQLRGDQDWAENREGAELGLTLLAEAVWEEGREERNTVLVLKEEVTKRLNRAIYKYRREMGRGAHDGPVGLSKVPSG